MRTVSAADEVLRNDSARFFVPAVKLAQHLLEEAIDFR